MRLISQRKPQRMLAFESRDAIWSRIPRVTQKEVIELVCRLILARARTEGVKATVVVFPDWSPWFQRWQEWRWRVYSSDYLLIGIIQNPSYDTWWLRRNWWYQLAELDVI